MSYLSSPHFKKVEEFEPDLRILLPAELYAELYVAEWTDQNPEIDQDTASRDDGKKLKPVFDHLGALQKILSDYTSTLITEKRVENAQSHLMKRNGALMFTDLAGFTKLMEANAKDGKKGAENLLTIFNDYFTNIIEIVTKAGGDLLEFTGDALLILFQVPVSKDDATENKDEIRKAVGKAVRAGLRMQRAMKAYSAIPTPGGPIELKMRIGIHSGHFYSADIGTPRRREHVLLGKNVQQAKKTESNGKNGEVNLSLEAFQHIEVDKFQFKEGEPGYMLVVDNFHDEKGNDTLGDYEVMAKTSTRRFASTVLLDKSFNAVAAQIDELLKAIKQLASFIPTPVLNLLIESAAKRKIPAEFPSPTIMFVNFIGLPEMIDKGIYEEDGIVGSFNETFARINAAVEKRGGVLKKVTYHLTGSDIVIYFGVPTAHTNDPLRAVSAALDIVKIVRDVKIPALKPGKTEPIDDSGKPKIYCQIGINMGDTFVAEIGDPRGRREFNVLGDTVNTTARLMSRAEVNQILISESVQKEVDEKYQCTPLGNMELKGKSAPMPIFELTQ